MAAARKRVPLLYDNDRLENTGIALRTLSLLCTNVRSRTRLIIVFACVDNGVPFTRPRFFCVGPTFEHVHSLVHPSPEHPACFSCRRINRRRPSRRRRNYRAPLIFFSRFEFSTNLLSSVNRGNYYTQLMAVQNHERKRTL